MYNNESILIKKEMKSMCRLNPKVAMEISEKDIEKIKNMKYS